jgi:hypothetical protein
MEPSLYANFLYRSSHLNLAQKGLAKLTLFLSFFIENSTSHLTLREHFYLDITMVTFRLTNQLFDTKRTKAYINKMSDQSRKYSLNFGLLSISSPLNVRIFRTNVVFLVTFWLCQKKIRAFNADAIEHSCQFHQHFTHNFFVQKQIE